MVLFTPIRAGLGRLGLALALVRAQCVARLLERGCEQERHLLDWCLEGACHLGEEHFAGREL